MRKRALGESLAHGPIDLPESLVLQAGACLSLRLEQMRFSKCHRLPESQVSESVGSSQMIEKIQVPHVVVRNVFRQCR